MKYPGLKFVAGVFQILGVIIAVLGSVLSIAVAAGTAIISLPSGFREASVLFGIIGVVVSIVAGLTLYAKGDYYQCLMDIEKNTRDVADVAKFTYHN